MAWTNWGVVKKKEQNSMQWRTAENIHTARNHGKFTTLVCWYVALTHGSIANVRFFFLPPPPPLTPTLPPFLDRLHVSILCTHHHHHLYCCHHHFSSRQQINRLCTQHHHHYLAPQHFLDRQHKTLNTSPSLSFSASLFQHKTHVILQTSPSSL